MSIHNIPFSILKKKITLNYSKSAAKGFFPMDSRTSSKQPWQTSLQCSSHLSSTVNQTGYALPKILSWYQYCKWLNISKSLAGPHGAIGRAPDS